MGDFADGVTPGGATSAPEGAAARPEAFEPTPIDGVEVFWNDSLERLPDSCERVDGIRQSGGRVEVEVEDVAVYRMVAGTRIEVRLDAGSDRETARFFLRATPYGILIQQRGEFPLHAGALVPPWGGPALLVAGDSGAGKSTTCAALVRRGWRLLNDDLTRLSFEADSVVAWPGFRDLKLGADSARLLGLDPDLLRRTRGFKEKYLLPIDSPVPPPSKVGALAVLEDAPRFQLPLRISGMELLEAIYRQTFRPHLVVPLGFQKDHFAQVLRFAALVPCFRAPGNRQRPPERLAADLEEWFARSGAGLV